jgi:hypothetical protein
MSRQQDLLFCKIAVANGMVSEANAKKCLAIVNKREQDSGRRPQIGAVFSKYNILHRQQVQMVYEAVNKRMGGTAPPAGKLPAASRGDRRPTRTKRGFGGREEREVKRKVDPTTLWVGVAFGVVFLGVIIALVVMFFTAGPDATTETDGKTEIASDEKGGASAAKTGAGKADGGPAGGPGATKRTEMDPARKSKITFWINDARFAEQTDPAKALKMMEDLKTEVETKNVFLTPDLESEIADYHAHLVKKNSGDAAEANGTPDSPDEGAGDSDLADDL